MRDYSGLGEDGEELLLIALIFSISTAEPGYFPICLISLVKVIFDTACNKYVGSFSPTSVCLTLNRSQKNPATFATWETKSNAATSSAGWGEEWEKGYFSKLK